jgi:hypothetical protein
MAWEDGLTLLLSTLDLEMEQKIAIYKASYKSRNPQSIRTVTNQKSHSTQTSIPHNCTMPPKFRTDNDNQESKTKSDTEELEYNLLSVQNQLGLPDIWDYDIAKYKENGEHWCDCR